MLIVAHRGACKEAPENSIEAFQIASTCGSDRIELDIHETKDHELVVNHDPALAVPNSGTVNISDCNYDEIKHLEIPTLRTVLKLFGKKISLNIEVKPKTSSIINQLETCLDNQQYLHIVVSSFHHESLEASRKLLYLENIDLALLWAGPEGNATVQDSLEHQIHFLEQKQIKLFHPYVKFTTAKLVETCRTRNIDVIPYVSAASEESGKTLLWRNLQAFGVAGLCTNYPRELASFLGRET